MNRTMSIVLSVCCLAVLPTVGVSAATDDAATARVVEELGLRESAVAQRDRPGWSKPQKVLLMGADAARVAWMQEVAPGVKLVAAPDRATAARGTRAANAALVVQCLIGYQCVGTMGRAEDPA